MVEELKKFDIIPEDVSIDTRMFAMRNSEHVRLNYSVTFLFESSKLANVDDN